MLDTPLNMRENCASCTTRTHWVAAVSKCFQVSLAPLLTLDVAPTCPEIRTTAFNSYAPCYTKPDNQGSPSVCALPLFDYFDIIWTIKSSFNDPLTATEALCAGLDVFRDCSRQWGNTRPCMRSAVIALDIVTGSDVYLTAGLSAALTEQLSRFFNWNDLQLKFIGCLTDRLLTGKIYMNVILALPDHISCLQSAIHSSWKRSANSVNLDDVMRDFQNAVRNGSLLLKIDGVTAYVSAHGECDPIKCQHVTTTYVNSPPLSATSSAPLIC